MTIKSLVATVCIFYLISAITCKMPQVYYANIGGQARLQCNGNTLCFSTYTFQNTPHPMITLMSSRKYEISMGYVVINNINEKDAGFYTCASVCTQMKSDQISYFIHPVSMGQPIDLSKTWVAIPPLPSAFASATDNFYVVVSDEREYAAHRAKILSDGEIAGLVIGLFFALVFTIAVVVGLILLYKRRNRKNKQKNSSKKSDKDTTSIDYSTIERDFGESATNTLTRDSNTRLDNKKERQNERREDADNLRNIISEISTKDIDGPRSFRVDNFNSINDVVNSADLPNIDINIGSGNAYQNQLFDNFKEEKPPSEHRNSNQYSNQPLIQFPQSNPRKPPNPPKENKLDPVPRMEIEGSQPNISGGSVTVVSARTPAVREQKVSTSSNQSNKQNKQISFSQRIETTSTPFQLHMPPSQSFREADYTLSSNYFNKDGATDV